MTDSKKNTPADLYNKCKINWNNFFVSVDDCQDCSHVKFDVMPLDYLKFAKNNLKDNTTQSCIDGMGNAKRAIESQIDLLIKTFGYDFKIFDKGSSYPQAKTFIKNNYTGEDTSGITPRLKLLNVLGLAPTLILSSIRNLRNDVEHEYIIPSYKEVCRAIEIAELFIYSINGKITLAPTVLLMSNHRSSSGYIPRPSLRMEFYIKNNSDIVEFEFLGTEKNEDLRAILTPNDKFYIESIKCLIIEECDMLPSIFGYNIEKQHINWTYDY